MRQIRLSAPLLDFLDELNFTKIMLSIHEETQPLTAAFGQLIDEWQEIFTKYQNSRLEALSAEARFLKANRELDFVTQKFAAQLLVEAGNNRKNPLFLRFFPTAPSTLTHGPYRQQCETTRDRLIPEIAKLAPVSPLKPYEAQLSQLVQTMLEALDNRTTQKTLQSLRALEIEQWKEGVNRVRTAVYGELLKIAMDQGEDRAWVESFFMKQRSEDQETPEQKNETPA